MCIQSLQNLVRVAKNNVILIMVKLIYGSKSVGGDEKQKFNSGLIHDMQSGGFCSIAILWLGQTIE